MEETQLKFMNLLITTVFPKNHVETMKLKTLKNLNVTKNNNARIVSDLLLPLELLEIAHSFKNLLTGEQPNMEQLVELIT